MNKFNLKEQKTLERKAFYEGVQGYMRMETRAWQNCYKQKYDAGMTPHNAWEDCLNSYQKAGNKADWLLKNASSDKEKK